MSTNKNIPYSVLELASVAVNKTPHDVFKNSLDLAQQAEALGYTRFWLAEHHNMADWSHCRWNKNDSGWFWGYYVA